LATGHSTLQTRHYEDCVADAGINPHLSIETYIACEFQLLSQLLQYIPMGQQLPTEANREIFHKASFQLTKEGLP